MEPLSHAQEYTHIDLINLISSEEFGHLYDKDDIRDIFNYINCSMRIKLPDYRHCYSLRLGDVSIIQLIRLVASVQFVRTHNYNDVTHTYNYIQRKKCDK